MPSNVPGSSGGGKEEQPDEDGGGGNSAAFDPVGEVMACGCAYVSSKAPDHKKHGGPVDKCYKCVADVLKLRQDWKEMYEKDSGHKMFVLLRAEHRNTLGRELTDREAMVLQKCVIMFPDIRVRAYVRGRYGDGMLHLVGQLHEDFGH